MFRHKGHLLPRGLTIVEILIVLAVLGIAFGIGVGTYRQILVSQEAQAAITSIRQIVAQGTTLAASRAQTLELVLTSNQLQVRTTGGTPTVVQSVNLPAAISSQLTNGTWFQFLPPGKISSVPSSFDITSQGRTYTFTFSLIGEVRAEVQP